MGNPHENSIRPRDARPTSTRTWGHNCSTSHEVGWSNLSNGDLLREAENTFDLLITTDKNLRYQQNLSGRRLAIIVLPTTSWPKIQQHIPEVIDAVTNIKPGEYRELSFQDAVNARRESH
jgi:hypothetical protein